MPGAGAGPGFTVADHVCWAQRIAKEEVVNARAHPGGFSVRAAVNIPDVPSKFKPGHIDPKKASSDGFDPNTLGWDPQGSMTTNFRRCMNQQSAGPRQRYMFPETCQQEIGWIQAARGETCERAEPAGSKPTRLGVGWLAKDGHGGMMARAANEAGEAKDIPDKPEKSHVRKSKDRNIREDLGMLPYALTTAVNSQAALQPFAPQRQRRSKGGHSSSRRSRSKSELSRAGQSQLKRARSASDAQVDPTRQFMKREEALSKALENSRQYLNQPGNMWYKPLSNSDVEKYADSFTKAWGVGLYAKKS
eukprot:TRINITY_DN64829_c0_g1_i1.p1 TRINITY_DN64829_c0_g1~~TRINITY_DN64829_c0_g1_i1.p1  ORF type:complete len:305 (+),score=63.23 TRINITY_DN64829_c0_g1_i1:31-945(+)